MGEAREAFGYPPPMFDRLKRTFRREPEPDPHPVALVMLETTPRVLSRGQIAQAVTKATGRDFPVSEVEEGDALHHRIRVDGYVLTFEARPVPYIPKDREPSPNLRIQDLVDRHEAAVLLDCWDAPRGRTREDGTDLMGRILIELADETSIGMYCFHAQRLNPVDEKLVGLFREGHAREAMEGDTSSALAGISTNDAQMAEAIAEARRRWPEFVAAFAVRNDPEGYGVKAPFRHSDRVEHMWIEVEEATLERVIGRVLNSPLALPRPRQGDRVTVPAGEISDWGYQDGDRRGGGFSDAIVQGAMKR